MYGAELVIEEVQHESFGITDALKLLKNPLWSFTIEDYHELTVVKDNSIESGMKIVSDS